MLTVCFIALISAVDHEFQAIITSASYAFRATGSTLGVTFAGALFQNVLRQQLEAGLRGKGQQAEDILRKVRSSFGEVELVPEKWKGVVVDAYMRSLKAVFYLVLGFAVLAWICSAFLERHKLYNTLKRDDDDDGELPTGEEVVGGEVDGR